MLAPSRAASYSLVAGTAVQRLSATGELLFHWSPFDPFQITDVDVASRTGAAVNWTHGNSFDLDADGEKVQPNEVRHRG